MQHDDEINAYMYSSTLIIILTFLLMFILLPSSPLSSQYRNTIIHIETIPLFQSYIFCTDYIGLYFSLVTRNDIVWFCLCYCTVVTAKSRLYYIERKMLYVGISVICHPMYHYLCCIDAKTGC